MVDNLAALRTESARFAEAAAGDEGAGVPSCPAWTMRDLVVHLGTVQRGWAAIVRRGGNEPPEGREPGGPGAGEDLLDWFAAGSEDLLDAVTTTPPDRPAWTWWPAPRTAGAILRHQVQEAAVHRWDAQLARGVPKALDPEVAADAIDEFLHISVAALQQEQPWAAAGGVVELAPTDVVAPRWLALSGDGTRVVPEPVGAPAVTLAGTASDLLLVLYRRIPRTVVTVRGDGALADAFVGWLVLE